MEVGEGRVGLLDLAAPLRLDLVRLGVDRVEHRLDHLQLPLLAERDGEVLVDLLVALAQLDALGVVLVEVADVERVGGVHFAARRHQRRRILEQVDLLPVDFAKVAVLLDLGGAAAHAADALLDLARQQRVQQIAYLVAHRVRQLHRHVQRHLVDLVLVLGLLLAKRTMSIERMTHKNSETKTKSA